MTRRRRYLLLALILLFILGGAGLLQRILFPRAPRGLQVVSVKGEVSLVSKDSGAERDLLAGEKVEPGDAVKTGHEGEAIMRGEGTSTITLSEHTRVGVDGVLDGVSRLRLEEGRVVGDVKEGEKSGIAVTGGRDGATATTKGGRMAVAVDGSGDLAIAALSGKASVTQGSLTRDLEKGDIVLARGGALEVEKMPTSVLLKVAWPEAGRTREPTTVVKVKAPRGTYVRIADKPVKLSADGEGSIEVALNEGENTLRLEAGDVVGNRTNEESGVIVLDTQPPHIHGGHAKWK